jgi:chromosome segregation ATPase
MPAKPQYIQDLMASVGLLNEKVRWQGRDINRLKKATDSLRQAQAELRRELLKELTASTDRLKDAVAEIRREAALTNQRLEALTKRMEEWERRWWALNLVLVGAVLSLASGLIVILVRR